MLENKHNVRGLLEIIAAPLVPQLDFDRLVQLNRSFLRANLREQESDLVYRVPFQNATKQEELLIYILIEHQSTVDVSMAFRILFYMMQIWDGQRRQWEAENVPKGQWKFRPILPIVFYTGDRHWKQPLTLQSLMDVPEELKRFVPQFDTLFLSVKESDAARLTETNHPFGWLLSVLQKEHAPKEELRTVLLAALRSLNTLDNTAHSQWRQAIWYLQLLIFHRRQPDEQEELIKLLSENIEDFTRKEEEKIMAQTIAEYLRDQGIAIGESRGREEGEARGREEGEAHGKTQAKQEAILKLLELRFQQVPETVNRTITEIQELSHLDVLFEKVATAQSLDEIQWNGNPNVE